ncbi:CARDB domain-containing protein [Sorangium sp. So ce1151]|uniref:CARDB domain-containing protein n=1 Tax=Sorangium sp. So ce1151 TaxID=3133332 RepID=UPI003F648E26
MPHQLDEPEILIMRHARVWVNTMLGLLALPLSSCAIDVASEVEESESLQATEQALTDLPDLVVESFTLTNVTGGVLMTMVIKNQGTAAAGSMGYAFLNYRQYLSPLQPSGCSSYGSGWAPNTGPLAAGASRTFTSTVAGWTVSGMESCSGTWYTTADAIINSVAESDETNNVKYGRD